MSVSDLNEHRKLLSYVNAFSASGWDLNVRRAGEGETPPDLDGPHFYLCDIETGKMIVIATVNSLFELVEAHKQKSSLPFEEICNHFGSLFGDVVGGKLDHSMELSSVLALSAGLYISGTQGYKIARTRNDGEMHYLVIRQTDYSCGESMLRPVPIAARSYYSPEEMELLVDHVLAIDRKQHPARFKSAKVIPFRITSHHKL